MSSLPRQLFGKLPREKQETIILRLVPAGLVHPTPEEGLDGHVKTSIHYNLLKLRLPLLEKGLRLAEPCQGQDCPICPEVEREWQEAMDDFESYDSWSRGFREMARMRREDKRALHSVFFWAYEILPDGSFKDPDAGPLVYAMPAARGRDGEVRSDEWRALCDLHYALKAAGAQGLALPGEAASVSISRNELSPSDLDQLRKEGRSPGKFDFSEGPKTSLPVDWREKVVSFEPLSHRLLPSGNLDHWDELSRLAERCEKSLGSQSSEEAAVKALLAFSSRHPELALSSKIREAYDKAEAYRVVRELVAKSSGAMI